ncbi:caveolin-1-like [Mya arenaria]|uniref:caveolin-1-like n=1 Tax=Mya arenaria TaxID=6604 RepID=UPI0022E09EF1|nr:caveolin-1-like [Mya arenaria]
MGEQVDLMRRDPNELNCHVKAEFEDVFGEPEGVRSIDCVWKLAFTCFNLCKGLCYKITTLLTGICIAMELGCTFAEVAYTHVWFVTPCMKLCEINCVPWRKCFFICIDCCLGPLCESCGLMLSKIKISKA